MVVVHETLPERDVVVAHDCIEWRSDLWHFRGASARRSHVRSAILDAVLEYRHRFHHQYVPNAIPRCRFHHVLPVLKWFWLVGRGVAQQLGKPSHDQSV